MDALSIISGGLSALGGLFSNNSASKEAEKNRKWQEYMSNTSHQREVKDLRAAGLNPILSAGGGGASTPSGNVAPVMDAIGAGVNSANAARLTSIAKDKAVAEIQNINADTQKKGSDVKLNEQLTANAAAQHENILADTSAKRTSERIASDQSGVRIELDRALTAKSEAERHAALVNSSKAQLEKEYVMLQNIKARYENAIKKDQTQMETSKTGRILRRIDRVMNTINGIISNVAPFLPNSSKSTSTIIHKND